MDLDSWREKGTFFDYKSHQVFTIEEGTGDAMLLIHGFPTASWDWHKMWPYLLRDYRLIAVDMIGFGFSDKPRRYHYSIMDQADMIEKLLTLKKVGSIHILSHDYGDTVAQELIARHNERQKTQLSAVVIKSVCLLNGGLFPEVHRPLVIQKLLMGPFGYWISQLFTRSKLGKNFKKTSGRATQPTEEELDIFWRLMTHHEGKKVFHLLIRYINERVKNRKRWVSALRDTDIPLRFINGSLDPISGKHMADRYEDIIPEPDVIALEEIGHYPSFEAPEMVWEHYQNFRKNL